jgi:hypothetical protein
MHPGSLDTYEALFNYKDGLERYRILEDFGKYVLNGVNGDVLEIGVGESSYYLSRIAKRYNRRLFHCDISPSKIINPMSVPGYLSDSEEITYVEDGKGFPEHLKRVVAYAGPSDKFFKVIPMKDIALAFIDGDHNYDQAKRDFWNTWEMLLENGMIFLHDTYPPDKSWTNENRCGDVYRLRQELEKDNRMDVLTVSRGTCIGVGLTIVRKRERGRAHAEENF